MVMPTDAPGSSGCPDTWILTFEFVEPHSGVLSIEHVTRVPNHKGKILVHVAIEKVDRARGDFRRCIYIAMRWLIESWLVHILDPSPEGQNVNGHIRRAAIYVVEPSHIRLLLPFLLVLQAVNDEVYVPISEKVLNG
jgi:hypothetical protein